jgi:hypothetical protein
MPRAHGVAIWGLSNPPTEMYPIWCAHHARALRSVLPCAARPRFSLLILVWPVFHLFYRKRTSVSDALVEVNIRFFFRHYSGALLIAAVDGCQSLTVY